MGEKVKNLSLKYIPFGLLVSFVVKSLIMGLTINEVLVIGVLAALNAFYEYPITDKKIKEFQEELKEIREHDNIQDKRIEDLKTYNVTTKISSSVKNLAGR